jgi:RNA recognition motif-containing protein
MGIKLYAGNLSSETTETDLTRVFAQYGKVLGVKIRKDADTGESRGYGYILMEDKTAARTARSGADGHVLHDQPLKVRKVARKQK